MDISSSIVPDSSQINAEDLLAGPQTFTITEVSAGNAEQPVNIHMAETDRAYRPSKTMRRLLVAAWGPEATSFAGRRVTLYRDDTIRFGKDAVGGIRISHMSHIDKAISVALTVTRGKRQRFTVEPLVEAAQPTPDELAAQIAAALKDATTEAEVREWGNRAHERGLLDIQVDAQTLRGHVTEALAVIEQGRASERHGEAQP